jgi:hypothetical protein
MMPPFEGLGSDEDAAFHFEMMKNAARDDEDDGEDDDEELSMKLPESSARSNQGLSNKARLFGNPTPFPNEALLEKLSNKLA